MSTLSDSYTYIFCIWACVSTLNFFSSSDCTFIICFDISNLPLTITSYALGLFSQKNMKRLRSKIFLSSKMSLIVKSCSVSLIIRKVQIKTTLASLTFKMTIKGKMKVICIDKTSWMVLVGMYMIWPRGTCEQWDVHTMQGHSTLKLEKELAFWNKVKPEGSYVKFQKKK